MLISQATAFLLDPSDNSKKASSSIFPKFEVTTGAKNIQQAQPRFESIMNKAKESAEEEQKNREKQKEFEMNPPLRSPFPFGGRGVHYVPSQWRHPPPPPIPPMPMPPAFSQILPNQPTPHYSPGVVPTTNNMRFQQQRYPQQAGGAVN